MSKTQVKSNDRFSKFRMESPLGKFFTILLYVVMTIIVIDRASSSTSYHCGILF